MTLKSAALFAFVGTLLLAILLAVYFISDVLNVSRGLTAVNTMLASFLHALAALSVAVFFFVFHQKQ